MDEYSRKILEEIVKQFGKTARKRKDLDEIIAEAKNEMIVNTLRIYSLKTNQYLKEVLNLTARAMEELVKGLTDSGYHVVVVDAKLVTPGIFGVSQGIFKSVFEVGMFWDHIFDLPFIPGSSFKGAIRGMLESILGENCKDSIEALFGCGGHEGWAGLLIFFDAYPIAVNNESGRLIEPNIISPHYSKGGKTVKWEYEVEPVPIPHVSIAPGTVFRFIIALEPDTEGKGEINESIKENVKNLMSCLGLSNVTNPIIGLLSIIKTVFNYGLGARTSQGYGKFEIIKYKLVFNNTKYDTPVYIQSSLKRRGRTIHR